MIKKWFPRILLGMIVLFIGILLTAPAQIAKQQLEANIQGVKTKGTAGRLWSGQFSELNYQNVSLSNIRWQLSASALFSASLGITLDIDDDLFRGSLYVQQAATGQTSIKQLNAVQSVYAIAELFSPLQLIQPSGELTWQEVSLTFDETVFSSAEGHIQWPDAVLFVNGQQYALGSLDIELTSENDKLVLLFSSDQILDLQGTLNLDRQNNYQLQLSVQENLPNHLYNAIRLMARSDGSGRLNFQLTGQF